MLFGMSLDRDWPIQVNSIEYANATQHSRHKSLSQIAEEIRIKVNERKLN